MSAKVTNAYLITFSWDHFTDQNKTIKIGVLHSHSCMTSNWKESDRFLFYLKQQKQKNLWSWVASYSPPLSRQIHITAINVFLCQGWRIFLIEWVTHEILLWKKAKVGHRFNDMSLSMCQSIIKSLVQGRQTGFRWRSNKKLKCFIGPQTLRFRLLPNNRKVFTSIPVQIPKFFGFWYRCSARH